MFAVDVHGSRQVGRVIGCIGFSLPGSAVAAFGFAAEGSAVRNNSNVFREIMQGKGLGYFFLVGMQSVLVVPIFSRDNQAPKIK